METVLISVGAIVPMLLLLVVIHELGHFATARSLGVKVLEFGVGFPPRAFGFYTGRTRVLISPDTHFVNLDGMASLHTGQLVKVTSSEDTAGNLVAEVIEGPRPGPGLLGRLSGRSSGNSESIQDYARDDWLKHNGKVRAVEDGSIVLADMLYSVNWAPLGGFVRLAGESNPDVPRSLAGKGVGTRFLILVAGPLMNAILPIIFFTLLLMLPQDVVVGQLEVAKVADGSPAQEAGVKPGDIIVQADGRTIENVGDLAHAVQLNGGSAMEWLIVRSGREQILQLQPGYGRPPGQWLAGIFIDDTTGHVTVTGVAPDSAAAAAGVQVADVVISAGERAVETSDALVEAINASEGSHMVWLVSRGGLEQEIQITPRFDQPEVELFFTGETTRLINPHTERRSNPPWVAFKDSFVKTWEVVILIKQAIFGAISHGSAPQLSGPIGIAGAAGELTQQAGFLGWMFMAILLSISLAILNILPVPPLDGGHLVFVVLEWVRRGKRVPPEREGLVHLIGFVVLIGLIILISANDVIRLIEGRSFLGG